MKNSANKHFTVMASLLAVMGFCSASEAHEIPDGQLGTAATATDLYYVNCYDDGTGAGPAAYLETRVLDKTPVAAPLISVQAFRGNKTTNSTDSGTDGDAISSPYVKNYGGEGVYYMLVNKTAAGKENYFLEYHCKDAGGSHTGTDIVPLQFQ